MTARVFVTAPTPVPQAIAIRSLTPDTPDTRAAVAAELAALFADDVAPATPSTPFTLLQEAVSGAINRATGVAGFTLLTPAADQTFAVGGQMPTLGTIGYS